MQKILKFLALFICLAVVLSLPSYAAEDTAVITAKTSENKVYLTVTTTELCYGMQATLKYDSQVLTYASAELKGAAAEANKAENSVTVTDDGIKLIIVGEQKGEWITIVFTVAEEFSGTTGVELDDIKTIDRSGNVTDGNAQELFVDIKVVLGDINGDGEIDIRDLVRLKKYLVYPDNTDIVEANADCDGTKGITLGDIVAVRKHLLGAELLNV